MDPVPDHIPSLVDDDDISDGPGLLWGFRIMEAFILLILLFFGVIVIGGFLFNFLYIMTFICYEKVKTITNLYIFNLAVVHEFVLVGILLLLYSIIRTGTWPMSELHCKVHYVFSNMYKITSSFFILALVVDRYFFTRPKYSNMVTNPKWRSPRTTFTICIIIWIFSTMTYAPLVPYVTTFDKDIHNATRVHCMLWGDTIEMGDAVTNWVDALYTFHALIFGFAIPILPTIIFFFLVKNQLRESNRPRDPRDTINMSTFSRNFPMPEEEEDTGQDTGWNWSEERSLKDEYSELVLVLVRAHCLCWIPYWIIFALPILAPDEEYRGRPYIVLMYMTGFVNSCNALVNPFLYFMHSEDIREKLGRAFYLRKESVPDLVL